MLKNYGGRPQNYVLPRRPLPFSQQKEAAFSGAPYPSIAVERNHIQVIQNKQSVPRLSVNFLRFRCSGFFAPIRRSRTPRGYTQYPKREADPWFASLLRMTTKGVGPKTKGADQDKEQDKDPPL